MLCQSHLNTGSETFIHNKNEIIEHYAQALYTCYFSLRASSPHVLSLYEKEELLINFLVFNNEKYKSYRFGST